MREIELKEALKKRCVEALEDLRFNTADSKQPQKPPTVLNGFYIPAENSAFVDANVEEVAPFVIVRALQGTEVARDEFQIQTMVVVQIFNDSPDFTGDTDCLLAMNRIRANIQNTPILDNVFQYDGGFKWQLKEEQPHPNWEIEITMNWLIPNTQRTDYNKFI